MGVVLAWQIIDFSSNVKARGVFFSTYLILRRKNMSVQCVITQTSFFNGYIQSMMLYYASQETRLYSKSMTGKREQSAISSKSDSDSDSDDETFSKARVRPIDELV